MYVDLSTHFHPFGGTTGDMVITSTLDALSALKNDISNVINSFGFGSEDDFAITDYNDRNPDRPGYYLQVPQA